MRFLFFLGPLCEGLRPQAVGERTLPPPARFRAMARFSPSVRSADSSLTEGAKYDSEVTIYERPAARLKKARPPGGVSRRGEGCRRGAAVALPDGAEQTVDVCFDLTAAPAGDFSPAFDGGLTLAHADASRMGL